MLFQRGSLINSAYHRRFYRRIVNSVMDGQTVRTKVLLALESRSRISHALASVTSLAPRSDDENRELPLFLIISLSSGPRKRHFYRTI